MRYNDLGNEVTLIKRFAESRNLDDSDPRADHSLPPNREMLNTPVTVVLGLTDLWKLSLTNDATGPDRQWVERISAAAGRLAKTVQRMFKLIENREFGRTLNLETVEDRGSFSVRPSRS